MRMKYVEMTAKDAIKRLGENTVVLVAIQDLEKNEECIPFVKKSSEECVRMINEAKTIAKQCDDFAEQLRLFTEKQVDLVNIIPRGKMGTILLE